MSHLHFHNRRRKKLIGIWSHGFRPYPHPRMLCSSTINDDEQKKIAAYIESSPRTEYDPAPGEPILCLLPVEPNLLDRNADDLVCWLRTDGEWNFPLSLAWYVQHGVRVPDAFLGRMRRLNYTCPVEIDRSSDDDSGNYWRWWSLCPAQCGRGYIGYVIRFVTFFPWLVMLDYLLEPLERRMASRRRRKLKLKRT